ncbi:MAG: leucyl aminopeptidase family protein [Capnocytophaga sp.]|nr:leucyl aminopeptidase family protein [Capnocytophaga sp.]
MKLIALKNEQNITSDVDVYVAKMPADLPVGLRSYAQKYFTKNKNIAINIPFLEKPIILVLLPEEVASDAVFCEKLRLSGHDLLGVLAREEYRAVRFYSVLSDVHTRMLVEGMLISNYQFLKYKTFEKASFSDFSLYLPLPAEDLYELDTLVQSVNVARNLVNEPVSTLNTIRFSEELLVLGNEFGFDVNVLNKQQITTLNMGGLLGVNAGSDVPPTFNILTWKPENAVNKQPFVLVGKGVVYDTGGYNIKPGSYMDTMKSDMAGGAAVAGLFCAVAQNKLPVYVIGLIPATDNRINPTAMVSDDVLTMMNGMTVEVKNTDAEGRLILADALVYAQRFLPKLVIDLATLTGAAARVTGHYGAAMMGNADEYTKKSLMLVGNEVYERLVEFPFWDEFSEDLKSPIADFKNLGNPEGGASSAGKFLEKFTDYPWLHLDIAGPAFLSTSYRYYKSGATGFGVRLLYHFLKKQLG